jgi:mono/diheme cytochrome c family protein
LAGTFLFIHLLGEVHMISVIYHFLESLGYNHPIHAPLTHMPIGLVVGALVFALAAWVFRQPGLAISARHCLILALLFFFPTALAGYMDWQYFYLGAWLTIFKIKLSLTGALLLLLVLGVFLTGKGEMRYGTLLPICTLCFLVVVVLGYLGGQLALGERCPEAPSKQFSAGAKIFRSNCSACHPQGGNIINPKLPLLGASQLDSPETFLAFVRRPVRPDGSRGKMPPFPSTRISDQQVRDLYEYIVNVFKTTQRR